MTLVHSHQLVGFFAAIFGCLIKMAMSIRRADMVNPKSSQDEFGPPSNDELRSSVSVMDLALSLVVSLD